MKKLIKMMILGMVVGSGTTLFLSASDKQMKPEQRKVKILASAPIDFIVEQAKKKFNKNFNYYEGCGGYFLYELTEEETNYFLMWQTFYKKLSEGNIPPLPGDIKEFAFIKPNLDFTSPEHDTLKEALNKFKNLSWIDLLVNKFITAPLCFYYSLIPCGEEMKTFSVYNHFLAVEVRRKNPKLNKFINFLAAATIVDCAILAGVAWLGYHYGLPLLSAGLQKASNWSSYEPGFKQDILKATHFGAQKVAQVGAYVSYIPAPITDGAQKIGAWGTTAGSYLPSTRNTLIGAGILGASSLLLGRRHVKNFIDEQICDVY